jgi:hypothetical protein
MQVGGKAGMQTMEAALGDLITRGVVTLEEARKRMPEVVATIERPGQPAQGPAAPARSGQFQVPATAPRPGHSTPQPQGQATAAGTRPGQAR